MHINDSTMLSVFIVKTTALFTLVFYCTLDSIHFQSRTNFLSTNGRVLNHVWRIIQLISAAFKHSVLRVWEIYALQNVCVLHCSLWAVQTINFACMYATQNIQTQLKSKSAIFWIGGRSLWRQIPVECGLEPKCIRDCRNLDRELLLQLFYL